MHVAAQPRPGEGLLLGSAIVLCAGPWADTYGCVHLPAGFIVHQCNAKLPPRMTPLKTKPAVDIPRGSEVRKAAKLGYRQEHQLCYV